MDDDDNYDVNEDGEDNLENEESTAPEEETMPTEEETMPTEEEHPDLLPTVVEADKADLHPTIVEADKADLHPTIVETDKTDLHPTVVEADETDLHPTVVEADKANTAAEKEETEQGTAAKENTETKENTGTKESEDKENTEKLEISKEDREKLDSWSSKYRPTDENYLAHKDVYDDEKYYDQKTGEQLNPPDNGFEPGHGPQTLEPGTRLDRYGSPNGYFLSPEGTPFEQRSLAPGKENAEYHVYEVTDKAIENVDTGKAAAWFGQPGGGTQYFLGEDRSVQDLIDEGYLVEVTDK